MKKYLITDPELKKIHEQALQARCEAGERLKLLCIYWAGRGKDVSWIHETLLLPVRTIYHYLEEYRTNQKINNDDVPADDHLLNFHLSEN